MSLAKRELGTGRNWQERKRETVMVLTKASPIFGAILSGMKGCLLCFLLVHLDLTLSRAQSPTSDQNKAQAALHSQVSRIGKDCPDAKTTAEENSCISIVEQQTRTDFAAFYGSLHSLLQRSPDDAVSQLDSPQEEWEHYAQKACDAVDSFYRGATIRPSGVTTCRIQLTRSRMRDLDVLYYTTLHL
ncbi:MAG TPA: lysozyme inhibitor LprI family protein [Bryobacteraceae bacterium]|jgi:uncharacterized protein YecT (DUF1311 family)|nr:lysozyme inhibitor LprI family protein [Bryobacteraceae bacterium]